MVTHSTHCNMLELMIPLKKTILVHVCIICHKITYSPMSAAQGHTVHTPLLHLYIHTKKMWWTLNHLGIGNQ